MRIHHSSSKSTESFHYKNRSDRYDMIHSTILSLEGDRSHEKVEKIHPFSFYCDSKSSNSKRRKVADSNKYQ